MLLLYTTEEIISEIYRDVDNKYDVWYEFLRKVKPAIIVMTQNPDLVYDDGNPVFTLLQAFDVEVYTENLSTDVESVKHTMSEVEPDAMFILAVDKNTARELSANYGVVCHSIEDAPVTNPLFQDCIELNLLKEESGCGWGNILTADSAHPINSLVISDRYLFSDDSGGLTIEDGIENIKTILQEVLPATLEVDFHVLVVFDDSKLNAQSGYNFDKLSTRLSKLKKEFQRPYNICFETVAITSNDSNYSETHNRRIISNYFTVLAERSLKAFRSDKSMYSQTISLNWAASKGVIHSVKSDVPMKGIYGYLSELKKAIGSLKKSVGDVHFTQNGNRNIGIKDIKNRLITQI